MNKLRIRVGDAVVSSTDPRAGLVDRLAAELRAVEWSGIGTHPVTGEDIAACPRCSGNGPAKVHYSGCQLRAALDAVGMGGGE